MTQPQRNFARRKHLKDRCLTCAVHVMSSVISPGNDAAANDAPGIDLLDISPRGMKSSTVLQQQMHRAKQFLHTLVSDE